MTSGRLRHGRLTITWTSVSATGRVVGPYAPEAIITALLAGARGTELVARPAANSR